MRCSLSLLASLPLIIALHGPVLAQEAGPAGLAEALYADASPERLSQVQYTYGRPPAVIYPRGFYTTPPEPGYYEGYGYYGPPPGRYEAPAYAPPGVNYGRDRSRVIVVPPQDRRPRRYVTAPPRGPVVVVPGAPKAARTVDPKYHKTEVTYDSPYAPGTIVVNTGQRFLYLVEPDGKALRYGVGVGREGFGWKGTHKVTAKREWPDWRPPKEMLARRPELPKFLPGGPNNPLGARALYIGSTLYRIHGSNEPWTIGHAVSSGCIRMTNQDVKDLYDRVDVGATVVVL